MQSSGQAAAGPSPYQQNMMIRDLWTRGVPSRGTPPAVDMWQQLFPSLPATVAPGTVITIPLRNVGLIKRVLVRFNFRAKAGATSTQNLTALGLSNFLASPGGCIFTDLANNQRINTAGWHLQWLASIKRRRPFGAATVTDTPFGFGNNFAIQRGPASIAAGGTYNCSVTYEIPFCRSDHDLRGVIFGDVTSATMQLQLTINPNFSVASTADPTLACFQSAGSDLGTFDQFSMEVVQNYLDQGPRTSQGIPILPALDLGTAYVLTQVTSALPVANQDNLLPFVNQRQFLSLGLIYDNQGLNAGTDITLIKLLSANFTQIFSYSPLIQALRGRVLLGDDMPTGCYWLDFSDRPIDTAQYGNMQADIVPSNVAGSAAQILQGYEAYGIIGLINQGGSLPSGA